MWSMFTSKPYAGYQEGRRIQFTNDDIELLRTQVPDINLISPGLQLGGWRGANNVSRGDKIGAFEINGYTPEAKDVKLLQIPKGRFLNERDMTDYRKVCVVGDIVADELFEKGEDPLDKYIEINDVYFKVIGQFKSSLSGDRAENEDRSIYIPFTTFQRTFNKSNEVGWFVLTGDDGVSATSVEEKAKQVLKKAHSVHPGDVRAIGAWNMEREMTRFLNMFSGIQILSWTVGTLTLLAGVIGISNIMLVIVKERTKEIGVRRAMGATPLNIIQQIILESMVLTTIAGILGFIAGVFLLEQTSQLIQHKFFANPEVDFTIAITALLILIISGVFAGIMPASRAVRIKPIEALRTE
jgi:putative ABC transport system permease protein